MLFLGDVAAGGIRPRALAMPAHLRSCCTVVNLEGALCTEHTFAKGRALYNSPGILETLTALNVRVANLANNHSMDTCGSPRHTIDILRREGIEGVGAGCTLEEAQAPVRLKEGDVEVLVLAFGWSVIGCRAASARGAGVNPLEPAHVLRSIEQLRRLNPRSKIVALMHWNYELEIYPQPMHRQLAFQCVEAGASAVVGCHPHCPSGIEWHGSAPIIYSLGNWFLPQGVFFGGALQFPARTELQLAFEWNPMSGNEACHWFRYLRSNHQIIYLQSESALASRLAASLTPYRGMPHGDYIKWFKEHRVKRRGLPVYKDYRQETMNRMFDGYVYARQRFIEILFGLNLRRLMSEGNS